MTTHAKQVIVVIRLSSLGDCLLLGPVFRGLRKQFPKHHIVWLTKPAQAEIWQGSPLVNEIVAWRNHEDAPVEALRAIGSIEYVLDLQASPRTRKLCKTLACENHREAAPPRFKRALQIWTKGNWLVDEPPVPLRYLLAASEWGVQDDGLGLELPIDVGALSKVVPMLRGKKWITLAPGSKHFTKRWPWEHYLELAKQLQRAGHGIFWMFGPEEQELLPALAMHGVGTENGELVSLSDWKLSETIATISQCAAVVTNDSAAMHIAAGVGVRGIALFGPTIQQFGFAPFRSKLEVKERTLWCRPCSAHGGKFCPLGHHNCLRTISVGEVWTRLQTILAGVR